MRAERDGGKEKGGAGTGKEGGVAPWLLGGGETPLHTTGIPEQY